MSSKTRKLLRDILLFITPFIISLIFPSIPAVSKHTTSRVLGVERFYHASGIGYVQALSTGNLKYFIGGYGKNPHWETPLSKIVVGLLYLLLKPFGLSHYPIPTRIHAALFLSLTCLLTYKLAEKIRDSKTGIIAWFLLFPSFFLTPYEIWFDDELLGLMISEPHPHTAFGSCLVDLQSITFLILSIYYLYDFENGRNLIKAGFFFGLANLSKRIAFPILLIFSGIWFIYKKCGPRLFFKNFITYNVIGLSILIIGNPVWWDPTNIPVFLSDPLQTYNMFHSTVLMDIVKGGDILQYRLIRYLTYLQTYPLVLFTEFYLIQLFTIVNVVSLVHPFRLKEEHIVSVAWFFSAYVFIASVEMSTIIGSYLVNYYAIHFFPPLALYCSMVISDNLNYLPQKLTRRVNTGIRSISGDSIY